MHAAEYAAIYDAHATAVFRTAHAMLRDEHLAEDVTHDVFLRLWRRPQAYDPSRGAIGPYLRVMARSQALDAWRRTAATSRIRDRVEAELPAAPVAAEDASQAAVRGDTATVMRSAVRRLPEAQREVVALAYWGGLTATEIADGSGVPLGTIKSRMRLALIRLRDDAHAAGVATA